MSFERLKDYLSDVTFEVSLAKGYIYIHAKTTADHSTHPYTMAKERATYVQSWPMQVTTGVVIT